MYEFSLDTKIYGYVYMIHDSLNNKYYIGVHKWNKVLKDIAILKTSFDYAYYNSRGFPPFKFDNKYFGSGVYLKRAIQKYGRENFYIWDILDVAMTYEELYDLEMYWIKFYKDIGYNLYNLSPGGKGGSYKGINLGDKNGMFGKHHSAKTKFLISLQIKGRKPWNKGKTGIYSQSTLQKFSKSRKKLVGEKSPQYGLKRSDAAKIKMREAKKNIKWLYKGDKKRGATTLEQINLLIEDGYTFTMSDEYYKKYYANAPYNKGKKFNKEKRCYE